MRIDENTLMQARTADVLVFFMKYHGFTFAHRGGEYRCKEHPSLAVKSDCLSWYWHSKGIGGHGALDYLTKVENIPFRQAVQSLIGIIPTTAPPPTPRNTESPKTLKLPEKKGITIRLYDYLCVKRSIDSTIVSTLIQKEMLYEDKRGNVVFVGYDEKNKPKYASLRGTNSDFRGDCSGSDKRYSFRMTAETPTERLYIFESPIDAMSHASLINAATGDMDAWKKHSRLSLGGTNHTPLDFFLNQHKTVKELVFCLDNDTAGRTAAVSLARKYADKGYHTRLELPTGKDHNEDLQALKRTKTHNIRKENYI